MLIIIITRPIHHRRHLPLKLFEPWTNQTKFFFIGFWRSTLGILRFPASVFLHNYAAIQAAAFRCGFSLFFNSFLGETFCNDHGVCPSVRPSVRYAHCPKNDVMYKAYDVHRSRMVMRAVDWCHFSPFRPTLAPKYGSYNEVELRVEGCNFLLNWKNGKTVTRAKLHVTGICTGFWFSQKWSFFLKKSFLCWTTLSPMYLYVCL